MNVVKGFLRGARAGVALRSLSRSLEQVNTELVALYDRHASQGRPSPGRRDQAYRGHLWMLHQDLAGYILLGDPAARLPLAGLESPAVGSSVGPVAVAERGERGECDERIGRMERAVAALLTGESSPDQAAGRHGFARDELERWLVRYREAGRNVLEQILASESPDAVRDGHENGASKRPTTCK